jgi:peptidoglycan/LPS O-acetylase OafA/YrhL
MMIGAILAVVYYNTKFPTFQFRFQGLFNLMFKRWVQWLLIVALSVFIYLYIQYDIAQGDLIISVLAAMIIVNLCEPQTSVLSFGNSKLKFIGKISYGIYLLHKYPLFLVFYLVKKYMATSGMFWQNIVTYIATIILVIALASLSYFGFERYFLRIKSRFQKITQNKPALYLSK